MFYTKSIQLQVFLFKNCFILFCLRGFCVIWVCGVFWGKYLILSTFPLNYPYVGQCLSLNTLAVKLLRSSELLFLSSWYSFFLGLTNLGSKDIKSNLFQIAYQSINHRTQYHCVRWGNNKCSGRFCDLSEASTSYNIFFWSHIMPISS